MKSLTSAVTSVPYWNQSDGSRLNERDGNQQESDGTELATTVVALVMGRVYYSAV